MGRPAAACVAELRRLGLKPNSVPEPVTEPFQAGMVIAQEPPPGEFVVANSRVRVEIGDHSLFDTRKYDTPSSPPPRLEKTVPAAPEPLGLGDAPALPWVSEEELVPPPTGEVSLAEAATEAGGLESRWESLSGEPDADYVDDPVVEEEYPDFDPETGELLENEPATERAHRDEFERHGYRARLTRKQRHRMLLALAVAVVLIVLFAFSHLGGSGKHGEIARERVPARARVVTVTVTAPVATHTNSRRLRHTRRRAAHHTTSLAASPVIPASAPRSAPLSSPVVASSSPKGNGPAYLSPTGVVSPPPDHLSN